MNTFPSRNGSLRAATLFLAFGLGSLLGFLPGRADTFDLNGTDASATSTFNHNKTVNTSGTTTSTWISATTGIADTAAPAAGNDYVIGIGPVTGTAATMRSPADAANGAVDTFAGDSLTVTGGGILALKSQFSTTLSVNNLILSNGGTINQGSAASGNVGVTTTMSGNIMLGTGGGTITSTNGFGVSTGVVEGLNVASSLSGGGTLALSNSVSTTGNPGYTFDVVISGNNSLFSGAVNLLANTFQGNLGTGNQKRFFLSVEVGAASSLGTGAVTLAGVASTLASASTTLTLDNASAISNALTIGDATNTLWALNLNFIGTDIVSALTIDGVTYAAGTVINAASGIAGITGTGSLTVVPEPSEIGLALLGAGMVAAMARRRSAC